MKYNLAIPVLLAAMAPVVSASAYAKAGKSHAHIGHVMKSWGDTPDKMGFLPTAIAEAKITHKHANLAAKDTSNLKAMKLHATHVLHTLDPNLQKKGPGLGYGVVAAAKGTAAHIGFAAKSAGASKNVKAHAKHVSETANNTSKRAGILVSLSKKILAANSAAEAASMIPKLVAVSSALNAGEDLNGDGKVSWKGGEGGLMTAKAHMGFMMKGEGLK